RAALRTGDSACLFDRAVRHTAVRPEVVRPVTVSGAAHGFRKHMDFQRTQRAVRLLDRGRADIAAGANGRRLDRRNLRDVDVHRQRHRGLVAGRVGHVDSGAVDRIDGGPHARGRSGTLRGCGEWKDRSHKSDGCG
ncbi:hypothetical protein COLO4_00926, partial [Corchorus olitorius]